MIWEAAGGQQDPAGHTGESGVRRRAGGDGGRCAGRCAEPRCPSEWVSRAGGSRWQAGGESK